MTTLHAIDNYTSSISVPPTLYPLLNDVADARSRYVEVARRLTDQQAKYKPAPDVWSAVDITEHLFWAEQGGIWGMWRAVEAYRTGTPIWTGEHTNRGRLVSLIPVRRVSTYAPVVSSKIGS